jgi:hypothetical protein
MVRTDPSALDSLSLARIDGDRQPASGGIPMADKWPAGDGRSRARVTSIEEVTLSAGKVREVAHRADMDVLAADQSGRLGAKNGSSVPSGRLGMRAQGRWPAAGSASSADAALRGALLYLRRVIILDGGWRLLQRR